MLGAGIGKVFGSKMHIEALKQWRLPQWFRVFTGIIELGAAILLIIGFWNKTAAIISAAILVAVGISGVITHVRVKDSMKAIATILVIGVLSTYFTTNLSLSRVTYELRIWCIGLNRMIVHSYRKTTETINSSLNPRIKK